MEEWEIDYNKHMADEMMVKLGYAPKPTCEHCRGLGVVHPNDTRGKPIWSETVMCTAKGCMKDSHDARSL